MSGDADKPLDSHSNGCVDGDSEEYLSDWQEDWDEVGEGEEGVVGWEDWQGEHQDGEEDAGGVRHQQQGQHLAEDWLQLQVLLLQNDQCQKVT